MILVRKTLMSSVVLIDNLHIVSFEQVAQEIALETCAEQVKVPHIQSPTMVITELPPSTIIFNSARTKIRFKFVL